jgi:serine/threonine protein kinase/Tol biopolymer transport system component
MALSPGTRVGPYELVAPIGSGAMGDVYRARDTRLNRDVAIKVLPPVFARDPDRLARFEREARAVAAINHPNILAVHDIGNADVIDADHSSVRASYMITELLDGDTLRARLAQGPLPLRKSMEVTIQIARGLSAAHDRGIIHRDLKPENIVLLRDGHVKILDFGLAKQSPDHGTRSDDQQTVAATDAGTVLGTVGYMAPEQVRGEPADSRSDLFALGAVLYELVSGRRAFDRPTAAETMTAILREDPPDLAAHVAGLTPPLDRFVRHALEKNPSERFQSARDFAFALQAISDSASSGAVPVATGAAARRPIRGRELAAWIVAATLGATAATAIFWRPSPSPAATSPIIFTASPPWSDAVLHSPSVSPDGTRIAFIVHRRTEDAIVVRRLDGFQPQSLKGTTGARAGSVFWSPDGQAVGFFAGGKLKTLELASEKLEEIADAPSGYGGTWGLDGTILFSPDERAPIYRVNAKGGDVTQVTTLDPARHDMAHRWPQFLPDGRHFVFIPWTAGTVTRAIQLGALDGTPSRTLFESESAAIVAGNYLLYVRDVPSRFMAQAFNPDTLQLEGRPATVVADDNIDFNWASGNPLASASAGTLVYSTGKRRTSQLTWFNRAGRALGTVGEPGVYFDPTLSPDGTMLAVEKGDVDRGSTDLWTVDLTRGAFSRLTSAAGFESVATWSPDDRRIAFSSDQAPPRMMVKNANGTGAEEVISESRSFPMDWSSDGRYLLFMTDGGTTRMDIWVYDDQKKTSVAFAASAFNERRPKFSPDGKWIAYVSDESRDSQVYARSFPDGAVKVQISNAGGTQPEWRRDGKELFYMAPDGMLMAVELLTAGAGLVPGIAQPLFQTNDDESRVIRNQYAVSADGQRFLVMAPLLGPNVSPLIAVVNWKAAQERK